MPFPEEQFELQTLGAVLHPIFGVKLLMLLERLQLGVLSQIAIPRPLHALVEELLRVLQLLKICVQYQVYVLLLQRDVPLALVSVAIIHQGPRAVPDKMEEGAA